MTRFTPLNLGYSLYLLDKNAPFLSRNPDAVRDEPDSLPSVWRRPQPIPHTHEDHEINVVVSGMCRYVYEYKGVTYTTPAAMGQILAIPGGVSHIVEVEREAVVRGFWLHPDIFRLLTRDVPGDAAAARFAASDAAPPRLSHDAGLFWTLQRLFEQTQGEYARSDLRQEAGLRALASLAALALLRLYETPAGTLDHPTHERVLAVRAWMDRNFLEPVTLTELADRASLSVSQFSGIFRRLSGVPPKSYLLGLRLNQATSLLTTNDLPITQVALSAGFDRLNHFNDIFRQRYAMSPTQYRMQKTVVQD